MVLESFKKAKTQSRGRNVMPRMWGREKRLVFNLLQRNAKIGGRIELAHA